MESEEHKAACEAAVQSAVPEEAQPSQAGAVPRPMLSPQEKPRSGYARKRAQFNKLLDLHAALQAEHERLQRHHEALKAGHQELQAAFDELLQIHNGLLTDLKQSHQVRSVISGSPLNLMGQSHG